MNYTWRIYSCIILTRIDIVRKLYFLPIARNSMRFMNLFGSLQSLLLDTQAIDWMWYFLLGFLLDNVYVYIQKSFEWDINKSNFWYSIKSKIFDKNLFLVSAQNCTQNIHWCKTCLIKNYPRYFMVILCSKEFIFKNSW